MTLKIRVIPVLLWNGRELVHSTNFKRPHRIVGSMMQAVENMENRSIDELIILDVEAMKERRPPLYTEIQEYTSKLFAPLTVGGGVDSLDKIEKLLKAGADKVAINTALYENPDFVYDAARKFGSQCIVASINSYTEGCDSKYDIGVIDGGPRHFYTDSNGQHTNEAQTRQVCKFAEELGCGEILLTDVYANGSYQGYNTDLIFECSYDISIPVIANGGCGTLQHMVAALRAGANAVAATSMYMFRDITPKDVSKFIAKEGFPARV